MDYDGLAVLVPVPKATEELVSHEKEFDPLGRMAVVMRLVL
jgi:hypothetical protein